MDSVTISSMGQVQPVDKATSEQIKEEVMPFPELKYASANYQLTLAPFFTKIDGKDAYLINLTTPSGKLLKEYFDASTGLKIRREMGSSHSSINYEDYKEVNGILFPSKESVTEQVNLQLEIKDVKINSGLTDEDFK